MGRLRSPCRESAADELSGKNYGLALAADTAAYAGRVSEARELNKRAVDSAIRADKKENGAVYLANAGLQQAAYGKAKAEYAKLLSP